MDAPSQWRLYQGIGYLAEVVTETALKVENLKGVADDKPGPLAGVDAVLSRLYDGIREARDLLPILMTYAGAVFAGRDGLSPPAPPAQQSGARPLLHAFTGSLP